MLCCYPLSVPCLTYLSLRLFLGFSSHLLLHTLMLFFFHLSIKYCQEAGKNLISNLNFLQKPMMLKSMNTCGMAAFHRYTQASLRQFWANYVIWWFVAKSIIFFWNFLSFYAPSTPMSMHFFVLLGVRDFFKVNRGGLIFLHGLPLSLNGMPFFWILTQALKSFTVLPLRHFLNGHPGLLSFFGGGITNVLPSLVMVSLLRFTVPFHYTSGQLKNLNRKYISKYTLSSNVFSNAFTLLHATLI